MREGEKNGRAELNWQKVGEIRYYYSEFGRANKHIPREHRVTIKKLSAEYKKSPSVIHGIIHYNLWAE